MTMPSIKILWLALLLLVVSVSGGSWSPISLESPPYTPIQHPLPLTTYWSSEVHAPYPTNTWWINLVLMPATQPIMISPFSMRVETIEVSKIRPYNRTAEYEHCHTDRFGTHCPHWLKEVDPNSVEVSPSDPLKRGCNFGLPSKHVEADLIATFFQPGFTMSAVETLSPHQVTKWDTVSVTVQFTEQHQSDSSLLNDGLNRIEFPLVRGMPYATGIYTNLTPFLFTGNAILAINEQDQPGVVTGNKLHMKINNEQTVLVYAFNNNQDESDQDEPIQWQWTRNSIQLVGPNQPKGNWSGPYQQITRIDLVFLILISIYACYLLFLIYIRVIRMTIIAPTTATTKAINRFDPTPEEMYDQYANTYPLGGEFDYKYADGDDENDDSLITTIQFQTQTVPSPPESFSRPNPSSAGLLMMSLPHQQLSFILPHYVNAITIDTVIGNMVAVAGKEWVMSIPAVSSSFTSFRSPRPIAPSRVPALKLQLLQDLQSSASAGEPDPYGFGKSLAKIGRMALMAEEVGLDVDLLQELVAKMKDFVAPWLESLNPDTLLYDTAYGGIVSTNGVKDPAADFGQGYYNDHHFHYGYIIYGCAVIAHFDPDWAAIFRENIFALLRDYANPSPKDPFFPVLRHFDFYSSHSWASGLFVFADGRNQESSSESINSYYAMMLLGSALQDQNLMDLGRMLVTLEIQGTNTYWHSREGHTVYPSIFAANKCVGMVWSDKVVEATWFAAGMVYVHGINMLPFTPVSELYLTQAWVQEEYPVVVASVTSDINDSWKGFLYGTHCVIDSNTAWDEITGLTSFDGGNTRSNLMYFCATRPNQEKGMSPNSTRVMLSEE